MRKKDYLSRDYIYWCLIAVAVLCLPSVLLWSAGCVNAAEPQMPQVELRTPAQCPPSDTREPPQAPSLNRPEQAPVRSVDCGCGAGGCDCGPACLCGAGFSCSPSCRCAEGKKARLVPSEPLYQVQPFRSQYQTPSGRQTLPVQGVNGPLRTRMSQPAYVAPRPTGYGVYGGYRTLPYQGYYIPVARPYRIPVPGCST